MICLLHQDPIVLDNRRFSDIPLAFQLVHRFLELVVLVLQNGQLSLIAVFTWGRSRRLRTNPRLGPLLDLHRNDALHSSLHFFLVQMRWYLLILKFL